MKVKCIIVDDEELALDILEEFIRKTDFLQLEGRCRSAIEALNILNRKKIDLIFLDIQMPEITGFQLIKNLPNAPSVIITTAYPNYAVEGFELAVLDYLLKPIPFERFLKAVNRYSSQQIYSGRQMEEGKIPNSILEEYIFLRTDKKMVSVQTSEIVYIESIRNYVVLHLSDQTKIKTMNTISSIEEKLAGRNFLRIHRSYLVAVQHIQSFTPASVCIGSLYLPFGRNYKLQALNILNKKSIN